MSKLMGRKLSKLMGRKRGMTQLFDNNGQAVPCTVIEIEPNVITQIKGKKEDGYKDGYNAIQIAFDKIEVNDPRTLETRVTDPLLGHYKKAGVDPRRALTEFRVDKIDDYKVGQELKAELFGDEVYVNVTGISKGKGYQGVVKMYHYAGGPAAHGSSFHRHAGSTGMRSTPGRCLPGGKRASHMGLERKTVENLKIVKIQDNLLIVQGAVPGPRNGLVYITRAKKREAAK